MGSGTEDDGRTKQGRELTSAGHENNAPINRDDSIHTDEDSRKFVPVGADLRSFDEDSTETGVGGYVGRYQIIRRLGQGGFGAVFLARDQELERLVAVKLPHMHRMQGNTFRSGFLVEAKTLARLDHPGIVPIYDFGVIGDGRCFVVSKYIEGRDLGMVLMHGPIAASEVVRILIEVADALFHVHQAGIVHRDIKPANLLLGYDQRVYVADFGLAQRETPEGAFGRLAGTPGYMSPEQIRGEGHRIDGRSDLFSLGVTMYEMLTGERPFGSGTMDEIFQRIVNVEPFPPDQLNGRVPHELSRVCMKLLSKLASQRYGDGRKLIEDLRAWLATSPADQEELLHLNAGMAAPTLTPSEHGGAGDASVPFRTVVPRGLRAFTRADAGFFQDLLPGVRDRNGLPSIITHWKNWVQSRFELPELHSAGVIFGPTGCGKSSLVRAGIIPVLPDDCLAVIVDSSADLTEKQLRSGIARRCYERIEGDLPDQLAAIRRGGGIREDQSLLIVLDQFEQWLHAHPEPQESELVRAIRQCDGVRIQCLLLIRDDFWLALTRFMELIEVPLQLGNNASLVDLFDRRHAQKVLAEFGRGYGQLPYDSSLLTKDQQKFIEGAVDSLSVDSKVIPVHLALFAEMVKNKEWNPATLRQFGGASGIGARFLKESFSAASAPAHQKVHEQAARKVLEALLPTPGTEIKASRRTRAQLEEASGYAKDPGRFSALMSILETDLKLMTASETLDRSRTETSGSGPDQSAWQLSHDFLVPSVREWVTVTQNQSIRGRLHHRISEQARYWSFDQDVRHLPGGLEWMLVRYFVSGKSLSFSEAALLKAADRRMTGKIAVFAGLVLVAAITWKQFQRASETRFLVSQLATAVPDQSTSVIDQLEELGSSSHTAVREAALSVPEGSRQKFLYQTAELRWGSESVAEVFDYAVRSADIRDVPVAAAALARQSPEWEERCWKIIESQPNALPAMVTDSSPGRTNLEKFRALLLLAEMSRHAKRVHSFEQQWPTHGESVASLIVMVCSEQPNEYRLIQESFRPLSSLLLPELGKWLGQEGDELQTRFAVSLIDEYTADDPALRTSMVLNGSVWQIERLIKSSADLDLNVLWHVLQSQTEESTATAELVKSQPVAAMVSESRRRAVAGALLLRYADRLQAAEHQREFVWRSFRLNDDPTNRSQLMELASQFRLPVSVLMRQLDRESDTGVVAAIVSIAGSYPVGSLAMESDLNRRISELYQTHPNAFVHSTAEWFLRRHAQGHVLNSLPTAATTSGGRAIAEEQSQPSWQKTRHGFTLIHINAKNVPQIGHDFLISSTEVTRDQIQEYNPGHYVNPEFTRTGDAPASVVRWMDAVNYCNWLSGKEGLAPYYPATVEEQLAWTSDARSLQTSGYRLPTEAEWIYASLGGVKSPSSYGWDKSLLKRYGWFEGNHFIYLRDIGQAPQSEGPAGSKIFSKPIGLLFPNQFGLFDMYGNVEEWCDDRGQTAFEERVIHGGGARAYAEILSSSSTGSLLPATQYDSIGFRVVRTVPAITSTKPSEEPATTPEAPGT
ncbi:MAG: protein kinase [Planctomyces sp.]|nr:protein kinase [Planctomyces sp.]